MNRKKLLLPATFALSCALILFCSHLFLFRVQTPSNTVLSFFGFAPRNMNIEESNDVWHASRCSNGRRYKNILLWTPFFRRMRWASASQSELRRCRVSNYGCRLTTNRSELISKREVDSVIDAVVFHWRDIDKDDLPDPDSKPSDQVRVLFNLEPPQNTFKFSRASKAVIDRLDIDWMASYRKDSDLYAPYGVIDVIDAKTMADNVEHDKSLSELVGNKTRMAAWVVSNCRSYSHREEYVKILKKYMDVDIFGKCGNETCPRKVAQSGELSCWQLIENTYKFYLSFENSVCVDYVTEKFFGPLRLNVIPVVLGGANYSDLLPDDTRDDAKPNGYYINALDFRSPRELAMYMKSLANDTELYTSYLDRKRRRHLVINRGLFHWVCDLCERLHTLPENFASCAGDGEPMFGTNNDTPHRPPCPDVYDWWYRGSRCDNDIVLRTLNRDVSTYP